MRRHSSTNFLADLADRLAVVAPDVRDGLEVGRQAPGQPQLALCLGFRAPAGLQPGEVAAGVDLGRRSRAVSRPASRDGLGTVEAHFLISSLSTKTSITRTGRSSWVRSSRRYGNGTLGDRSWPSTYRSKPWLPVPWRGLRSVQRRSVSAQHRSQREIKTGNEKWGRISPPPLSGWRATHRQSAGTSSRRHPVQVLSAPATRRRPGSQGRCMHQR